jgi:hypothetical protein
LWRAGAITDPAALAAARPTSALASVRISFEQLVNLAAKFGAILARNSLTSLHPSQVNLAAETSKGGGAVPPALGGALPAAAAVAESMKKSAAAAAAAGSKSLEVVVRRLKLEPWLLQLPKVHSAWLRE